MGGEVSYVRCPESPADMKDGKSQRACLTRKKVTFCCGAAIAAPCALSLLFLGLYLHQIHSEPSVQLTECQTQLRNETSQAEASLLEREEAKAESDRLRAQLAAATQNLTEARGRWDSCQKEMKSMEKNFTSQLTEAVHQEEVKRQSVEEECKRLKQLLSDKSRALEDAQRKRDQSQEEIRQLQNQLKGQHSMHSDGVGLGGPITAFLLPILPGLFLL
ncbi:uncharacterized protein LOC133372295 [Rhineura floridana]|uniref:uncharacterized protein LOC133372295 n=1 Tax=Rhineura floridana TaxID=261503 RepID=UPI002AC86F65|nr:uncharacterized protein LOC133372295 [Rhineura floridana]